MQTRPTLIALLLLLPLAAVAGPVYKWTDADGVTHYSDQPQPGAEKVELGTVQTLNMPAPRNVAAQPPQPPAKKPAAGLGYSEVSVTSPSSGKTYTDEPIPVVLHLAPSLQPGHTIAWYLNDAPREETGDTFTIDRLDRGAYTIYATVTDATGADSVSSATVTFYVRQPSELAPRSPRR
jgi:hypothetical protein